MRDFDRTPIGRALDIPPGIANDELRDSIAAIERVHGDGALPRIPMSVVSDIRDVHGHQLDGVFLTSRDGHGGILPLSIRIRNGAYNRLYVGVHEFGHFLDVSGLPGSGFASRSHPTLGHWRHAVRQSRAYRELQAHALSADIELAEHTTWLRRADELWARSYTQFIAARSGSWKLHVGIDALRRRDREAVYLPRQWDDDDFVAIEVAIADLFWRLGWIA